MMKITKLDTKLKFEDLELLDIKNDGEKFYVEIHESVENGFPSPASDFVGEKLSLDERFLSKPECTYIAKAKGNSNYPTIVTGDLLIIRSDLNIDHDELGVFSVNNSKFTTKRLDLKSNSLISDNKDFPKIQLSDEDTVVSLGKLVAIVRNDLRRL